MNHTLVQEAMARRAEESRAALTGLPPEPPVQHITRIELGEQLGRVYVEKYEEHWRASSPPVESYLSDTPFDTMVAWLEESPAWTVIIFRSPRDGHRRARAWLGEMKPVRTANAIKWMRQEKANGRLAFLDGYDLRFWF